MVECDFTYMAVEGCYQTLGRMVGFSIVATILVVILLFIVILLVRNITGMRVKYEEELGMWQAKVIELAKKNGGDKNGKGS